MAFPKTAKDFFYWISVLIMLLMGLFQLMLSQKYLWKFDDVTCDSGTCTGEGTPAAAWDPRVGPDSAPEPGPEPGSGWEDPAPLYEAPATARAVLNTVNFATATPNNLEDPSRPVLVVVVSSAPRSGSTFVGELLSSPRRSVFYFEPFWFYTSYNNGSGLHDGLRRGETVASDLINLLTCRLSSLPPMFSNKRRRGFIWRKPVLPSYATLEHLTAACLKTSLRVVKTIRLRLHDVLPLLQVEGLNVHIVHLVRDPRAITNSIEHRSSQWPDRRHDAEFTCSGIRDDIRSSRDVTDPRLSLLRYEDIASRPLEEARRLFDAMNVPLPPDVGDFVESHMRALSKSASAKSASKNPGDRPRVSGSVRRGRRAAERRPARRRPRLRRLSRREFEATTRRRGGRRPLVGSYYGTFRGAGFDQLHWLRELPAESRSNVERACRDVLEALGYPLRYPGEVDAAA